MLYLITGKPGHGKTQYTIKTVQQRAEAENRQVFYKRIDDLTLDWEKLEEDQHWNDAPDGSIVVLDECQNDFRNRTLSSTVPLHVSELETHRHRGLDIYAITQNPTLIDINVRKLTGEHIHIHNAFGTNSATVLKFTEVNNDPVKNKNDALVKSSYSFDKDIWKLYKSATVHTHKKRIPVKIYFISFLVLFMIGVVAFTYNKLFVDGLAATIPEDTQLLNTGIDSYTNKINPGSKSPGLSKEEYLIQHIPRLKGRLETAPIYDEVKSIQSYPRIQCLVSKTKGCKCYTQQGTKIDVPEKQCLFHVNEGGYFNNSLPDYALNSYEDNYDNDYYQNIESGAEIEHEKLTPQITIIGTKESSGRLRYSKATPSRDLSD